MAGVAGLVREYPELAFKVEQIAREAASHQPRAPEAIKRALDIVESLECISGTDAEALVTLLRHRVPDGDAQCLMDVFLDVERVVPWLKANPQRRHDLAKLLECSSERFITSSDAIEFVLSNPVVQSSEIRRVLEALPNNDVAVHEYLRKNMAIVKELAENEYTESDLQAVQYRRQQLDVFKLLLNDPAYFESKKREWNVSQTEGVWDRFFQMNQWIFGYGLRYVFMTAVNPDRLQQTTTGTAFDRAGKRPDALMRTAGELSHLCFVEIKMHDAPLLKPVANAYRPECWAIGNEVTDGIVQVQQTIKKAEQERPHPVRQVDERGDPTGEELFLDQPKGLLVIGNQAQFKTPTGTNWQKIASFELFRRNITSPEILTYDQLLARAEHIVKRGREESQTRPEPRTKEVPVEN
ncbi:MAG: DUF4263 domain-containing protein [Planctomycetales bacterium]|nr:DUF4263 domain-containing protein [Planctomycetales bacterium]